jgi:hypothetical protein
MYSPRRWQLRSRKKRRGLTLEELEAEPAAAMASFGMRCAAERWQPEIGEA